MKLSGSKKIILLGLILLIVAGITIIVLKGFNVSLMYQQHEAINVVIGKEINKNDINLICKEVFKNKTFVVRTIDFFNDSVNINVESITDDEKNELVSKLNEKYGTSLNIDSLNISTIANIRIRDIARPYIKPIIISIVVIVAYLIIRFRKMNVAKLLGKLFGIVLLTEVVLASIIAIARIPVSPVVVNLMTIVAVIELILYINKREKEYSSQE